MEKDKLGYVDMEFGPTWKYVGTVRKFVENFLSVSLEKEDPSNTEAVVVAIGELVGNAVKYAEKGRASFSLQVYSNSIELSTANRTSTENIERLKKELDQLEKEDPLKVYSDKMKKLVEDPDSRHSLGLARICHETGGEIDCNIEGNVVEMNVRCQW